LIAIRYALVPLMILYTINPTDSLNASGMFGSKLSPSHGILTLVPVVVWEIETEAVSLPVVNISAAPEQIP
jgi:hypothetical protein